MGVQEIPWSLTGEHQTAPGFASGSWATSRPGYFFAWGKRVRKERAIVFIDGANLHYHLKSIGVHAQRVSPYEVARKLAQDREVTQVRYYLAEVDRDAPKRVFEANRRQLQLMAAQPKTVVLTGHIQRISQKNECAADLLAYLGGLRQAIPRGVYKDLVEIGKKHRKAILYREKGVDVHLACDLVNLAKADAYDVGYVVSGDADFAPAVEIARSHGKRVFAAGPDISFRLITACNTAIKLHAAWFTDCQLPVR